MLVNCSVCSEDINLLVKEVSVLHCGHFFHANCLNERLQQQMKCPECQAKVTGDNFVKNIFPKVQELTASQLKSLENECAELEKENSRLKSENSSLKEG